MKKILDRIINENFVEIENGISGGKRDEKVFFILAPLVNISRVFTLSSHDRKDLSREHFIVTLISQQNTIFYS